MEKKYTDEQYDKDYELKREGLEKILGKMHDLVGHSVVPFYMGGSVDLYYFIHHIKGTGFATMELLDIEGNGPLPNELGTYELLAFTKNYYDEGSDGGSAFNLSKAEFVKILRQLETIRTKPFLIPVIPTNLFLATTMKNGI